MYAPFQQRLLLASLTVALVAAACQAENETSAKKQYEVIKEGLRRNKHEMCSFLLADMNTENEVLELAKVTYLFESALDHLAKTSDYVTLMRPYVEGAAINGFDRQGSNYVLEISEARRRLIKEYERAVSLNASDLDKRKILEDAFYMACEFKLATVVAERAMYESALKAEKTLRVKLFANGEGSQPQ